MHSSTLFLVALASLMVGFTSAKRTSEVNAVQINGIPEVNKAVYVNKRRHMSKRKTDPYASTVQPQGSSGGGLTGGLTGGDLTGGLTSGLLGGLV